MSSTIDPVSDRPPMMVDIIYGRLHQAITDRRFEPGSLMTEQRLADQLNVSKTPVREALARLRQVGLVEPDGRRGMRVVKLSLEGLRQIFEVREALETYVAGRAADRADPTCCALISTAAQASLDAALNGDILGFHKHDRFFHGEIAKAVNNQQMTQQIENAVAQVQTIIRREAFPDLDEMIKCARDHVRIATAITAGARDTAAREMAAHIRKVHELLVAGSLEQVGADA